MDVKEIDSKTGVVSAILANGDRFHGEFSYGSIKKQGVYKWTHGGIYSGQYENELKHGDGRQWFADGKEYEGEYCEGRIEGMGKMKWPDGSVYDGKWLDQERHGHCTMKFAKGKEYSG